MERVVTQLAFEEFRLVEIQVPLNKPKSAKGFPFEFEQGRRMVQESWDHLHNDLKILGHKQVH